MNVAALLDQAKDAFYALTGSGCKTGSSPPSPRVHQLVISTDSRSLGPDCVARRDAQAERAQLQDPPTARRGRLQLRAPLVLLVPAPLPTHSLACAQVYLAQDTASGRLFALKKIRCPSGMGDSVKAALKEVEGACVAAVDLYADLINP